MGVLAEMVMVSSRTRVRRDYEAATEGVRAYFKHLPALVESFPLEVALAYVFSKVELAQNNTLYCTIVKKHRGDAQLSRTALDSHRMTRDDFRSKYEEVLGRPVSKEAQQLIHKAERVRDKVLHGKSTTDPEKAEAICRALAYADLLNTEVFGLAGFRPFGKLTGFKGGTRALNKRTTRWVLKGMGFNLT